MNKKILLLVCSFSFTALAEEGGSGHYMPGSMSSFMDGVPAGQTFITRLNILDYQGSYEHSLPFAGIEAADVDVSSKAIGLTMLYRPDIDLGENWSYAFSATIPYVDMKVSADVFTDSGDYRKTDSDSALGDIILMPLMINQHVNADLNINYRIALYAPTGSYEIGELANTGKNFWTVEPTIAAVYLGQKNGIEASVFAGVDFNQENDDTQYKSGIQAHLEGTFAQHFPLWGGLAGAGVTGFYYKQVTGDSGEGANFGDFKARSVGAGPTLSFVKKAGKTDILTELKWLHEFSTTKRVKGDTIFLKVMAKF
ncbi:transporter [Colwellia psychrerythraea]|uniref:Putative MetA-pathway of phenol degradation n=1 Tax=Colwellia psychrerythraea TaxID=28229 RepID=A0A099KAL8_COLPS|nr:transporter [Colwellia psychrerythraea]KGJ87350.1 putative MetA-pathway of phenol degradation [Colwellia psychrerythraea]